MKTKYLGVSSGGYVLKSLQESPMCSLDWEPLEFVDIEARGMY